NALEELGVVHEVVNTPAALRKAVSIILPGVGHFGQMMHALDRLGLRQPLVEQISEGVPYFGICLGMQALLEGSEEAPDVKGLGFLPGMVRRFPMDARVPHMGWNRPEDTTGCGSSDYYYFAHSYYVPVDEHIACSIGEYGGVRFMASLQNANI